MIKEKRYDLLSFVTGYDVMSGNLFFQIMYFCFDFLKYIMTEEFSVDNLPSR